MEKKLLIQKKDHYSRLTPSQRDSISHFILRLGFCRTEDNRRWFLTQECQLFKARLDRMSELEKQEFMALNGVTFEPVPVEERNQKAPLLMAAAGKANPNDFPVHNMVFYK